MSLRVYHSLDNIDDNFTMVIDNEEYFEENTLDKVDSQVATLLEGTCSDEVIDLVLRSIKSRNKKMLLNLQEGIKSVLNIYYNPDVYFVPVNCTEEMIRNIYVMDRGSIVGVKPYFYATDTKCDIIYRGVRYTDVSEFMRARMENSEPKCIIPKSSRLYKESSKSEDSKDTAIVSPQVSEFLNEIMNLT